MKSKYVLFFLMLGIGLIFANPAALGHIQYSVAEDFSLDGNPNGVWSYGYTSTLGGNFVLHPYSTTSQWGQSFLSAWYSGIGWDGSPQILKNMSSQEEIFGTVDFLPGQTILHPGPSDEKSIARWTAPADGTFEIQATFEGRDFGWGTHTDVHVLINGVSVFDDMIDGFLDTAAYSDTIALKAGDTVDFAVGFGGDYFNGDSTAIDATITDLDSSTLTVSPDPLVAGQSGTFSVTDGTPSGDAFLVYSLRGPGSTYIPYLQVVIDLKKPKVGGTRKKANANGSVDWTLNVPAAASGITIWFQAVQLRKKSNVVESAVL